MSEVNVVVGSGAAGLTAALTAREEGATVLIAESESVVGGATRLSGGVIMAADTVVHRKAGIKDSANDLLFDYMLANQFGVNPGLVRRMAEDGAGIIDWLLELGVEITNLMGGIDERSPRSHGPVGGGQHFVDVLARQCRERDIEIALGRRVDRLIVEDGAVKGVAVGNDDLPAEAVVLATGGFGANPALIEKYLPTLAEKGDWRVFIGPESSRGDGLALAEQVGANTVGFDRCAPLLVPYLGGARDFDSFLPAWMLLLGRDGRRICLETIPYGHLHGLVNAAGGRGFGFFDSKTLADNGTPALPTFKVEFPPGKPKPARLWNRDGIERLVDARAVRRADTVEELALMLELPVAAVAGSVQRYNRSAAAGRDADFDKDPRFLRPIKEPPFYGVEVRPAAFGHTDYGIEIDTTGAVLDHCSTEIPGLYAAGECAGGVLGPRYVGSGNSLASCVVFGRAAGRSAAKFARDTSSI